MLWHLLVPVDKANGFHPVEKTKQDTRWKRQNQRASNPLVLVREDASPCEVSTGGGEAIVRTQAHQADGLACCVR